MLNFSHTKLTTIIKKLTILKKNLNPKESLLFEAFNPDLATSTYSGKEILIDTERYIYRSYKSWVDLAHQLGFRMLTPKIATPHTVIIHYEYLNPDASFHTTTLQKEEKYGDASIFSQIYKNEEASFLYYYLQALQNVKVGKRVRILNLGVNSGDEFETIETIVKKFDSLELLGIDYCHSAIESAKERFSVYENVTFLQHDINDLETLQLEKFDLIISIGTLQSTNLEYNKLLMSIVQNQLKREGAIILGFPNCRWIDGEMVYGARVKNYNFSEMGLLYKDVHFAKKYLQQKKFRVTVTGKDYIFVTATSIR